MQIRMSRLEIAFSAPVWAIRLVAESSIALLNAADNVRRGVLMELYGVTDATTPDQDVQDILAQARDATPAREPFRPEVVQGGAHLRQERENEPEPMTTAQIEEAIAFQLKQRLEEAHG